MRTDTGVTVQPSIRLTVIVLALAMLAGCTPSPPGAVATAQAFWDDVGQGRIEAALARTVPGDRERQRRALSALDVASARVEPLEVPEETQVALLPTTLTRTGDAASGEEADPGASLETTTVLRRRGERWMVDLDATRQELRRATVARAGERLRRSAERLRESLGDVAPEVADALEELGEALREQIDDDVRHRSGELAQELGRTLEEAREALVEGLRQLEESLSAAPDAQSSDDGDGDGDGEKASPPR